MSELFHIKPKTLEIHNSNDIYMTMNICILSNDVNYNKAKFTDEYINGIIANKNTYIGIPFLVNREKLENAEYENLTHELHNGELKTDQIGSFVDFWSEEIDGATCLMGAIRIQKRFPNTCKAIIELYESNELETSCEVLVKEYKEITDDGIRIIDYNDGKNPLIGSCLVSNPAEKRARATLLIAEAHKKDLEIDSLGGGEEKVDKNTEVFNKGHEIKYVGKIESGSLSFQEVTDQVYNLLNPINPKTNERQYNYYIDEMRVDYIIVEEWNDYRTLWLIPYKIENNIVVLESDENWIEGYKGFIPKGINLDQLISDLELSHKELTELNSKIIELKSKKEELSNMAKDVKDLEREISEKENEFKELNEKVESLQEQIKELNETIVSQKETMTEKESKIEELNNQIKELSEYKEKWETAQKEAKMKELSEKYSKLLSEKTFKSEDVQKALNSLDEVALNSIVVSEVAKEKTSLETNSKEKDVEIKINAQKDLLPQDRREKLYTPRD